jgi:hypothetical protein
VALDRRCHVIRMYTLLHNSYTITSIGGGVK